MIKILDKSWQKYLKKKKNFLKIENTILKNQYVLSLCLLLIINKHFLKKTFKT